MSKIAIEYAGHQAWAELCRYCGSAAGQRKILISARGEDGTVVNGRYGPIWAGMTFEDATLLVQGFCSMGDDLIVVKDVQSPEIVNPYDELFNAGIIEDDYTVETIFCACRYDPKVHAANSKFLSQVRLCRLKPQYRDLPTNNELGRHSF